MNKKLLMDHCINLSELLAIRADRLQQLIELGAPQNVYADEVQMIRDAANHILEVMDRL